MTYTKPMVQELAGAVEAIQNGIDKRDTFTDSINPNHPLNATAPAYEADE